MRLRAGPELTAGPARIELDAGPQLWAAREDGRLVGSTPQALGVQADAAFQAQARPLMLRAATAGGAAFSELLPGVIADDGCAAILRYAR